MNTFLLNPWTVGIGLAVLTALCGSFWRTLACRMRPARPVLRISYQDGMNKRSAGPGRDEITCIWCGTLTLENPSPVGAFNVRVTLPDGLELKSAVPSALKCGDKVKIETQFLRSFDARKLFPSQSAKSFFEPVLADIDPNCECYPVELLRLSIRILCVNESGKTIDLAFTRKYPSEEMLAAGPEN